MIEKISRYKTYFNSFIFFILDFTYVFFFVFWKIILKNLHYSLRKGYIWYDDGMDSPEAINYRKIKIEYKKLVNKFNF